MSQKTEDYSLRSQSDNGSITANGRMSRGFKGGRFEEGTSGGRERRFRWIEGYPAAVSRIGSHPWEWFNALADSEAGGWEACAVTSNSDHKAIADA
jgi:hypothetical protein